jgi:hypothetical protein
MKRVGKTISYRYRVVKLWSRKSFFIRLNFDVPIQIRYILEIFNFKLLSFIPFLIMFFYRQDIWFVCPYIVIHTIT